MKDVDENAGDGQIGGDSELRKKPRADNVAADHGKREQGIDRVANKPQADKNDGPRRLGVSSNHQPTPAPASAVALAPTTSAVPHFELTTA